MSFIMFAITGLCVGLVQHVIAKERIELGLPGALLLGVATTFVGGVLGNLIAGAPLGAIRVSSAGGMAIAAIVVTGLLAIVAHRRHLLDVEHDRRIDRLTTTMR